MRGRFSAPSVYFQVSALVLTYTISEITTETKLGWVARANPPNPSSGIMKGESRPYFVARPPDAQSPPDASKCSTILTCRGEEEMRRAFQSGGVATCMWRLDGCGACV